MRVDGTGSGNVIQGAQLGMGQQTDAVSRDLQRKIDEAQKKLQEISSSKDMSEEEKTKKRQEMQKQIAELQNQLRQHQIQQRREAAGKAEKKNPDGNTNFAKKSEGKNNAGKGGKQEAGFSQAGMTSLLSADAALEQAQIQGSVAAKMSGKANVLEIEMKQDQAVHGGASRKQEELAAIEQKASNAVSNQMESLKNANSTLQEAAGGQEDKTDRISKAERKGGKDETDGREDGNGTKEDRADGTGDSREDGKRFPSIDIRL